MHSGCLVRNSVRFSFLPLRCPSSAHFALSALLACAEAVAGNPNTRTQDRNLRRFILRRPYFATRDIRVVEVSVMIHGSILQVIRYLFIEEYILGPQRQVLFQVFTTV